MSTRWNNFKTNENGNSMNFVGQYQGFLYSMHLPSSVKTTSNSRVLISRREIENGLSNAKFPTCPRRLRHKTPQDLQFAYGSFESCNITKCYLEHKLLQRCDPGRIGSSVLVSCSVEVLFSRNIGWTRSVLILHTRRAWGQYGVQ